MKKYRILYGKSTMLKINIKMSINLLLMKYCQNTYQFTCMRLITSSSQMFEKSYKTSTGERSSRKITVLKKSIHADKESSSVLEWKTASSVMKQLNWENKHLFGPLQSAKPVTYNQNKIHESNQIIQHETQIPIIEPSIDQNYTYIKSSFGNQYHKNELSNFRNILTFPLVNKSVDISDKSDKKVEELNILRKNLEFLCKASVPSVSLILEKTMPKERIKILNLWKQNMIKELGEEGFQKYHRDLLAKGTSLHCTINNFLSSTPESELLIKEENIEHWKSLKQVLPYIKDVKLLEEFVIHPFLCYRGVVDCFAKYKDQLVVIDWKTSKKSKSNIKSTYDNPLQIAAYVGALNFDPKYQYLVSKGLIVIAYESGMLATTHFIDKHIMLQYWKEWLQRLKQFWEMKKSEIENS